MRLSDPLKGFMNVTAFAIAMANVETMIVVYLRRLYYPNGFTFPLVIIDTPTLLMELAREACTVVMLATFGIAAGRTKVGQFAYFIIGFGIWDIFYYVLAQNHSELAGVVVDMGCFIPHSRPLGWSCHRARFGCLYDDWDGPRDALVGSSWAGCSSWKMGVECSDCGMRRDYLVLYTRCYTSP